jgi:hypothetical protein
MEPAAGRWLTFATTLSASLVAAVVLVVSTGWGGDDVGAFFFWTLPFAGLLALASRRVARRLPAGRAGVAVAAGLGSVAGLLWTIVVALLLGPFVLAFGFAIWAAWGVGGAAGLVAGTAIEAPGQLRVARRFAYGTLALVVAASVALYVAVAVYEWRRGVVVAELEPSTSDAQAQSFVWNVVMQQRGVESVTQNDPLVLEIELDEDATEAERAGLLETLRSSPVVERVEDDQ